MKKFIVQCEAAPRQLRASRAPTPEAIAARRGHSGARPSGRSLFARGAGRTAAALDGVSRFRRAFRHSGDRVPLADQCRCRTSTVLAGYQPVAAPQGGRRHPQHRFRRAVDSDACTVTRPTTARSIHLGVDPIYSHVPIRSFPCDVAVDGATAGGAAAARRGSRQAARDRRQDDRRAEQAPDRGARQDATDAAGAPQRSKDMTPISPIWASQCIGQAKADDTHRGQRIFADQPLRASSRSRAPSSARRGAGGLGWGVGAAIGVKIANAGQGW